MNSRHLLGLLLNPLMIIFNSSILTEFSPRFLGKYCRSLLNDDPFCSTYKPGIFVLEKAVVGSLKCSFNLEVREAFTLSQLSSLSVFKIALRI